jgi:hypothetical protein
MIGQSIIERMLKIKTLTLRIHCWGGLGSQLQALSFYLKVQSKFPNRNLQLILHTGGITERRSEIDFVSDRINLASIHDFKSKVGRTNANQLFSFDLRLIFKNFIRNILNHFRFVITDENRVMAIMPWTTQVRCSYSNIELSSDLIKNLGEIVQFPVENIDNNFIGVHLRIGDLVALKPESLVDTSTINRLINNLDQKEKILNKVIVYSDSKLNLDSFNSLIDFTIELRNIDTLNTIFDLAGPRVFIGTNSKVSLWVAIFRYGYKIPGIIFLPISIFEIFNKAIMPTQQIDDFRVVPYTP